MYMENDREVEKYRQRTQLLLEINVRCRMTDIYKHEQKNPQKQYKLFIYWTTNTH